MKLGGDAETKPTYFCVKKREPERARTKHPKTNAAHWLRMQDAQTRTTTKNKINVRKEVVDEEEDAKTHTRAHWWCARGCLMRPLSLLIKKRNPRSRSQLIFTVRAHTNTHTFFTWHFGYVRFSFRFSALALHPSTMWKFCTDQPKNKVHIHILYVKIHSFAHYTRA